MVSHDQQHEAHDLCSACNGPMRDIQGELVFKYEHYTITVTDIPMQQCTRCGERLVTGPVGLAVSALATSIHQSLQRVGQDGDDEAVLTDAIVVHFAASVMPKSFAVA